MTFWDGRPVWLRLPSNAHGGLFSGSERKLPLLPLSRFLNAPFIAELPRLSNFPQNSCVLLFCLEVASGLSLFWKGTVRHLLSAQVGQRPRRRFLGSTRQGACLSSGGAGAQGSHAHWGRDSWSLWKISVLCLEVTLRVLNKCFLKKFF